MITRVICLAANPAQQMAGQGCLPKTGHSPQAPGYAIALCAPRLSRSSHGARRGASRTPTEPCALEGAHGEHLQRASRCWETMPGRRRAAGLWGEPRERRAGRLPVLLHSPGYIWAPEETGAILKVREVRYVINARLLASLHRPRGRWESEGVVARREKGLGRNR